MLTPVEKTLIYVMQVLEIPKDTIIPLMLMLKDNKSGQNTLLDFLKNHNPAELTEETIIRKVAEITQ